MNKAFSLGLVLSLVDRISTPLKAIQRAQDSYNKSLGKMDAAILKTSRSWDILEKSIGRAGAPYAKAIAQANTMIGLGQKMAFRGAAGVAMGIVPVMDAAAVEQAMAEAATLGDMSAEEFSKRYSRSVMDISVNYGQAQTGVVKAMYQALSKQISADDVVPFMSQTAKLAKAGVTDIFTATDLAMTIKNAYKIPVADLGKNFDLMFQTVRSGGTTLPEIARNFQTVGAAASSAGVSLSNVQAAVAQMTLSGVATERAYTALRATITALRAPGSEAQKVFDKMGITMNAEVLQQNDLIGSMSLLEQKLSKLSVADRAQAMRDIFGSEEAMQFVNDFMKGGDAYKAMLSNMAGSTGALDEAFKKMSGTTTNKWQSAWQAMKAVSTALGNSLNPHVKKLLDLVTWAGLALAKFMDKHKKLTGIIFGGVLASFALVAALGVLFIAFGMVTKAVAGYRIAMNLITSQRGRVLTAIRGITGGVLQSARGMGGGITSMFPQILSGALSFVGRFGTIMRGAFVTGPWGWIALALMLLLKFKGPLNAFFGGVLTGIGEAFGPLLKMLSPLLNKFGELWGWLKKLMAPIEDNEKRFNRFAEAGRVVGKALAAIGIVTMLFSPLGWLSLLLLGIAWVVNRYWEPLKVFFESFWQRFSEGLKPVTDGLSIMGNALDMVNPLLDKFYSKMTSLGIIKESEKDMTKWAKAGKMMGFVASMAQFTNPITGFLKSLGWFKRVYQMAKGWADDMAHILLGKWYYIKVPKWLSELAAWLKKITDLADKFFGVSDKIGITTDASKKVEGPLNAAKAIEPAVKKTSWFDSIFNPGTDTGGDKAGAGLMGKVASGMPQLAMAGGGRGGGNTVTFTGDFIINIPGTSASPQDIGRSVADEIAKTLRKGW